MSHPLDGCRAKLERADYHFTELRSKIDRYYSKDPYVPSYKYDPKTGHHTLYVIVRNQPPPKLSLLIGDTVHNFRSALDHLAWQLVELNPGSADTSTQFPIAHIKEKFLGHGRWRASGDLARQMPGISPAIEAEITRVQPYQRGNRAKAHPLWMLHELDIVDKHRMLQLTNGRVIDQSFGVAARGGFFFQDVAIFGGRSLRKSARVARFQLIGPVGQEPDVQVNPRFKIFIQFGKGAESTRRRSVLDILWGIKGYIEAEVMPAFKQFFP